MQADGIFFETGATHHVRRVDKRILPFLLILGLPIPSPAIAANITVDMLAKETGSWTSNPLLLVEGAKTLYGSTTSPKIVVKNTSAAMDVSVDFQVDQNIFNQPSFNSTDLHAITLLKTNNERWSFNIQQRTDYDTTRTSELTGFERETSAKRHLGLSFAPQLSYSLSPLDTLTLENSWNISRYKSNSYTDYMTFYAAAIWSHKIDPLNTATIKVRAQRYQTTQGSRVKHDTVGPSIGWKTQFTPRLSASIAAGFQEAKDQFPERPNTDWKTQYTFSGNITYSGEQDSITLNATRSQYPYGDGKEALQTVLNLQETHAFTPLISIMFGATWQLSDYTSPQTGDTRSLTLANVGSRYNLTQQISANLSYQYRYKTLINSSRTAHDNAITFSLVYHPDPVQP